MSEGTSWEEVKKMPILELAKLLNDRLWAIALSYHDAYYHDIGDIQSISDILLEKLRKEVGNERN